MRIKFDQIYYVSSLDRAVDPLAIRLTFDEEDALCMW
jgi:hypothetical protein